MSERITSLEREERYWGPGETMSALTVVLDDGVAAVKRAETDQNHHSQGPCRGIESQREWWV
jgi:hypothetical protein